jgi:hypothetical protein
MFADGLHTPDVLDYTGVPRFDGMPNINNSAMTPHGSANGSEYCKLTNSLNRPSMRV